MVLNLQGVYHISKILHAREFFDADGNLDRSGRLNLLAEGIKNGDIQGCEVEAQNVNFFAFCQLIGQDCIAGFDILIAAFFERDHTQSRPFRNLCLRRRNNGDDIGVTAARERYFGVDYRFNDGIDRKGVRLEAETVAFLLGIIDIRLTSIIHVDHVLRVGALGRRCFCCRNFCRRSFRFHRSNPLHGNFNRGSGLDLLSIGEECNINSNDRLHRFGNCFLDAVNDIFFPNRCELHLDAVGQSACRIDNRDFNIFSRSLQRELLILFVCFHQDIQTQLCRFKGQRT